MAEIEPGAASGLLPKVPAAALSEGPLGTYHAERQSSNTYHLFSTGSPRTARVARPTARRPAAFEGVKCTVLPALTSIDPLLGPLHRAGGKEHEREQEEPAAHNGKDGWLPPLSRAQRSQVGLEEGLSRIYPGRCSSMALGSREAPVPSDEEFRGWLTMPEGGVRKALVKNSSQVSLASSDWSFSVANFTSESSDEGSALASPRVWQIMLLKTTFENSTMSPQNVAICLAEVLGMTMEDAEKKAWDAQARLLAVVWQGSSQHEAFAKVQALKKGGLAVQVASEAGSPCRIAGTKTQGGKLAAATKRRAAARDYNDLFRISLRGTGKRAQRFPASARRLNTVRRESSGRWKGEGAEVALEVLPEDPVGAFFHAERERQALERQKEGQLFHRPYRRLDAPMDSNSANHLAEMFWKHRNTIKKTAELITTQQKEELLRHHLSQQPSKPKGRGDKSDSNEERSHSCSSSSSSSPDPPKANRRTSEHRTAASNVLWEVFLDAVAPKQKIPAARKEACQMMRFFVYGSVGNEDARTVRESEKVFYESIGTKEQVSILQKTWHRLDQDGSGRVDIMEFRTFAESSLVAKLEALLERQVDGDARNSSPPPLPAWIQIFTPEEIPDFVALLCGKLGQLLLKKKSSFTLEDMMRLIWPCAQQRDLRLMLSWCRDFLNSDEFRRVRTPPLLPEADLAGLRSVFEYFDEERTGVLRLEDLVGKGLIYSDQAPAFFKQWDRNGDGLLDLHEFCEMMCPMGFRAHPESLTGSTPDGTKVTYDEQLQYWRLDQDDEEILAQPDP